MPVLPSKSTESTTPLCIGHSHVACISEAAACSHDPIVALNFWDLGNPVVEDEAGVRLRADVAQRIHQHPGPVFTMMGGSTHIVLGLLVHPRPFDFVLPTQPDLPLMEGAEILSVSAIAATMHEQTDYYIALMQSVAAVAQYPVAHMQAPPPHRDGARIARDIIWAMYPDMRQEVAPAIFRYKMWRLHTQIIEQACVDVGIEFIPCPARAVDAEGFLLEDYYKDGVHANHAYGTLLIEQMRHYA